MSFLNSVFCGAEGVYRINGVEVCFGDGVTCGRVFGNDWFGRSVELCLTNPAFCMLTFGYLHVFIHEMGHALATQAQGNNQDPRITVDTATCTGNTQGSGSSTLIGLAGPLAGVTLEVAKLVGATALAVLLPTPVGLSLGIFIGTGAAIWIFGELMYALIGILAGGTGDWEEIERNGTVDLAASLSAILGVIILGLYAQYQLTQAS